MELLPFEYIYQPQVSSIYEYVLNVVSIFSLATFPLIAYTVLSKSPELFKSYKWLIFSTINWCFIYDVVICVCEPMILAPFWMGYINGITSRLGAYAGYFQFEIIIFIYAHTIFNLASCLMYRVTQALPPTDGYFFAEKRNSLIFMAIIYVTLVIPPCVLMPMSRINLEIVQEKLRKDVFNITEEFIKSNAIFGYDPSENPIFYIALSSIAISLLGFIILSSGLAAQLYFAIKKIGPLLSPETRHMQMMLYKVTFLQFVSITVFFASPIIFLLLMFITGIRSKYTIPLSCFLLVLLEFHALTDYFILLYFIKPYRKFVASCFHRVLLLFRCKTATVSPAPLVFVTSGVKK